MSDMCSCNRSRDYDALLERYERLEKVAKRMLDWCDGVTNRYFPIVPDTVRDFKKQLELLGVSVYD